MDQAVLDGAQEVPPGHEEELPCVVTEHWNRHQQGCGVSLPGDVPEPSGHTPALWDD